MKISESGKNFSDVISNSGKSKLDRNKNIQSAQITVTDASTVDDIMGLAVVWDDANSTFVPYTGQVIATITAGNDSDLPDGSAVAIVTGGARGDGYDVKDVDLTAGVAVRAYYRDCEAVREGIEMGAATAAQQDAFVLELEKQSVSVASCADEVTPSYL